MSFAAYVGGVVGIAIVVAVVGHGARALRRSLMPAWRGAHAALAELVIALATVLAVGQLLGALHWFSRYPVFGGEVAAGSVLVLVARRIDPGAGAPTPHPTRRVDRRELVAACAGIAVVVVQWTAHTLYALTKGMTYSDTLWYHAPFAARFVQHHSFDALDGVGLAAARLYPLDSPLLHALGALAFDNDLMSPLLNLGWMFVALLAAWCVGERFGVAPISALGAAVAVGVPILTATQPGQASSDIATIALFLAAIALLLEAGFAPAPTAVAGLALGMAISTKITVAAPAAVLAVGVVVLAWRVRPAVVVAWLAALLATGSFWFVRNWWRTGSPVPWFDVHLGPIHLKEVPAAAAVAAGQPSLAGSWRSGFPRSFYLDGLWQSFGRLWPVVLAVLAAAAVVLVARGASWLHRLIGLALAVGAVGYLFTPFTGGFNFPNGLRFLTPLLLAALAVLPTQLPADRGWRRIEIGGLLVFVAASASMPTVDRVPAWPRVSIVAALLVVVAGVAFVKAQRALLVIAPIALVVGGFAAQRHYFDHRYVDVGLRTDSLDEYFRDVHDARIAVLGTDETYPMFGLDLSNDVRRGDDPAFDVGADACAAWRAHLVGYDYVAVAGGPTPLGFYPTPDPAVFADPAAAVVLRDGDNTVYRLDGALDPSTC